MNLRRMRMSRSMASLFINCDRCTRELEILLDDGDARSFDSQADKELIAGNWLVTDEEDICPDCVSEMGIEEDEDD
jgi:hypothetical protein